MKNEDELKQKFLDLIEISEKIKKNDVADYLEIPERELLFYLVKWKDLGFKIENEYLIQTKIIQNTLEGQKEEEKEEKSNVSHEETVFSSSQKLGIGHFTTTLTHNIQGAQKNGLEIAFLVELEQQIGERIPQVYDVIDLDYPFGFTLNNNKVQKLGLVRANPYNYVRKELENLPESIGNLVSLIYLNIHSNLISTLPESIGNLRSLTRLDISSNRLSSLPESFGNLKSLNSLNLYQNQLISLPGSIGNLKSLTYLGISLNQLSSLPESFGNLKSLRELHLNTNILRTLPDCIGNLSMLIELDLRNNNLISLPECIGNLFNLKNLKLENNLLDSLPVGIGKLTQLKYLTLQNNRLITLPDNIGNLTSLERLNLHGNSLTSIPESIENLISLKSLEIEFDSDFSFTAKTEAIFNKLRIQGCRIDYRITKQLEDNGTFFSEKTEKIIKKIFWVVVFICDIIIGILYLYGYF